MAEQRKLLDLRDNDQTRFCWACSAGHPNMKGRMGEFHSRGKCPVVSFSNNVHSCGPPINMKLFHKAEECPAENRKRLSNVIRLIDSRNGK